MHFVRSWAIVHWLCAYQAFLNPCCCHVLVHHPVVIPAIISQHAFQLLHHHIRVVRTGYRHTAFQPQPFSTASSSPFSTQMQYSYRVSNHPGQHSVVFSGTEDFSKSWTNSHNSHNTESQTNLNTTHSSSSSSSYHSSCTFTQSESTSTTSPAAPLGPAGEGVPRILNFVMLASFLLRRRRGVSGLIGCLALVGSSSACLWALRADRGTRGFATARRA
jgi:hypothetical protein